MIKFAWLVIGIEGYGVRRAILSLAEHVRQNDNMVVFISLTNGLFAKEIKKLGYTIYVLNKENPPDFACGRIRKIYNLSLLIFYAVRVYKRIKNIIVTEEIRWIHFEKHNLLPIAGLCARLNNIPCFWLMPSTVKQRFPFGLQKIIYQIMCWQLKITPFANSSYTATTLGNVLVEPKVLYLGVDHCHFKPDSIEKKSLNKKIPIFGVFARLAPDKAQDRVVKAILNLNEKGVPCKLLLVGGGKGDSFEKQIIDNVNSSKWKEKVIFVGYQNDPRPYFNEVDVVINSRLDAEPFGLSVIEAMMMQKPVLVYALGGPAETVLDKQTGWHISDCSVEGYEEGILYALENKKNWVKMGEKGRSHAITNFSTKAYYKNYINLTTSEVNSRI